MTAKIKSAAAIIRKLKKLGIAIDPALIKQAEQEKIEASRERSRKLSMRRAKERIIKRYGTRSFYEQALDAAYSAAKGMADNEKIRNALMKTLNKYCIRIRENKN